MLPATKVAVDAQGPQDGAPALGVVRSLDNRAGDDLKPRMAPSEVAGKCEKIHQPRPLPRRAQRLVARRGTVAVAANREAIQYPHGRQGLQLCLRLGLGIGGDLQHVELKGRLIAQDRGEFLDPWMQQWFAVEKELHIQHARYVEIAQAGAKQRCYPKPYAGPTPEQSARLIAAVWRSATPGAGPRA